MKELEKERAKVICMTPVKNEEWIMERFLAAASLWADCIIVADQHSQDRTASAWSIPRTASSPPS